jgi:hypothetical protein
LLGFREWFILCVGGVHASLLQYHPAARARIEQHLRRTDDSLTSVLLCPITSAIRHKWDL